MRQWSIAKRLNWLNRPFGRYLLVGGSVYLLELVVIVLAQTVGASPVMAVAIAFWVGLVVSFVLQKLVTFRDRRSQRRVVMAQVLAVGLLVAWNFAFTVGVTKLLASWLPPTVTRTIALAVTTLWNFYLYKTTIFRSPPPTAYSSQLRIQYDSLERQHVSQSTAAKSAPAPVRQDAISQPALIGLVVLAVAGYCFGLTIGRPTVGSAVVDSGIEIRSQQLATVLAAHPTDQLVGDWWQLLSIDHQLAQRPDQRTAALVPLATCTRPMPTRPVRLSAQSGFDRQRSFAYLLTTDPATPQLANCQLRQVTQAFGRPTALTVIAGTVQQPRELVVFYDHGVVRPTAAHQLSVQRLPAATSADTGPLTVGQLARPSCPGHRTIMQIVAHEDDDLLFMNPDLLHSIEQGDCVRTIYITAGDAGSSKYYWLSRERGSEAAYSSLIAGEDIWDSQVVKLGTNQFATISSPLQDERHSVIFLHLPDGRPDGQGFDNFGSASLAKLISGQQPVIQSVDGQSSYDLAELVAALQQLMQLYQPTEIRTQLPHSDSQSFPDHSDHVTVGQLTSQAFSGYRVKHPSAQLAYYAGYPVRDQAANVDGDDLVRKQQAFFTYAAYDGAVCATVEDCLLRGDYGEYLQRQYRSQP